MTWIQLTLPSPGEEPERPFQDKVADLDGPGEDLWRVYVAADEGEPQLVYQTRRWVTGADWADGGEALIISDWTAIEEEPGGELLTLLPNAQKLVPGEPAAAWEVRMPGGWYGWQSLGGFAIVTQRSGDAPVLLMSDGTAWMPRLQGQQVELSGASPDGRFIYFKSIGEYNSLTLQSSNANLNFVAEPLGDSAILAGTGAEAVFSPQATYLALFDLDKVSTFEIETGQMRELALPAPVSLGVPNSWSNDGQHLIVNDGVAEVETLSWLREPTNRQLIGASLSPNGETLALTLDPLQDERPCDEPALLNKTILVDVASGAEETLFDCDRFFSRIEWFGNERFITYTHTCWACEGASLPFLVSIEGAVAEPLSSDFSIWASHHVARDGPGRILVTGPELRFYAEDGTLFRSIAVEPGYEVTRVTWKPDASGFVFVVGPKGFLII
jgi:hypothetical protein